MGMGLREVKFIKKTYRSKYIYIYIYNLIFFNYILIDIFLKYLYKQNTTRKNIYILKHLNRLNKISKVYRFFYN